MHAKGSKIKKCILRRAFFGRIEVLIVVLGWLRISVFLKGRLSGSKNASTDQNTQPDHCGTPHPEGFPFLETDVCVTFLAQNFFSFLFAHQGDTLVATVTILSVGAAESFDPSANFFINAAQR